MSVAKGPRVSEEFFLVSVSNESIAEEGKARFWESLEQWPGRPFPWGKGGSLPIVGRRREKAERKIVLSVGAG